MTERSTSDSSSDSNSASDAAAAAARARAGGDVKSRIVEALMALVAERDWDEVSISDVARRAGVTLGQFRDAFPSKGAVLAALSRKIDRIVLDGTTDDLLGEPAKERLFDVLMRRLDAMAPYKAGMAAVLSWARRDPVSAAALNRAVLNSMRFMLEAARIPADGAAGAVKLQGLAIAWARVLGVWTQDDTPDLARTMAELDRELARGARLAARVDDMDRLAAPLRSLARSVLSRRFERRSRRHAYDAPDSPQRGETSNDNPADFT